MQTAARTGGTCPSKAHLYANQIFLGPGGCIAERCHADYGRAQGTTETDAHKKGNRIKAEREREREREREGKNGTRIKRRGSGQ